MKPILIKTNNNNHVLANIYEAANTNSVLVIASSTVVKQSFIKKFAEFFCENGNTTVPFDYTGIGESLKT